MRPYIRREIEPTIDYMLTQGKVVLVTGARQVGKTTVIREHLGDRFNYVSMEDPIAFSQAQADSLLFFDVHELPLIIDEIQRAPGLFSTIKFLVDESDERGRVVLTGSQTYHLMKGVSESLAGRIRILELSGLSMRELLGDAGNPHPYVPQQIAASSAGENSFSGAELWEIIHRGSMPELQDPDIDWSAFYADYVRTYLERDVRDLVNIKDEDRFYRFMVACAARSGQLFNASDIGDAIDADHKTVESWMSILQASGIIFVVRPFWPNVEKRITKAPKIYFMDTGLVCYLTRWLTSEQLRCGAAAGHVFETYVVSEIIKSYLNSGADTRDIWFYRDNRRREIDLVVQEGRVLHPAEIKAGMQIRPEAVRNFSVLEDFSDYEVGFGHVVCQTREPYLVTHNVQAVPVWAI